jgi:hypothetical protein
MKKKKEYAYIFNYETGTIDCLDTSNRPENKNHEEYIEDELDYSLTSCEWMIVDKKLKINYLN